MPTTRPTRAFPSAQEREQMPPTVRAAWEALMKADLAISVPAALTRLTGQKLGADAERWEAWWKTQPPLPPGSEDLHQPVKRPYGR